MTLAQQFVHAWKTQTKTIGAKDLAKKIDRTVAITRYEYPLSFTYRFADGSEAHTEGKGRHFKIWGFK